jgi:erythritol kinase
MTADIIIGIDAGTSLIKSIAFNLGGEVVAEAMVPNSYETLPNGGAEQDMARTWTCVATTLRQLVDKVPDLAERTLAISVTGQGDGTWLIDADGEPVAPAWLWLDVRATDIADDILAKSSYPQHYATTGTALNACQQSVQLAWLKRERPDILKRATTAFHCKDWLYFKLTGVRATDPSEAMFTYGDYRTHAYAPELLALIGIEEEARLLPAIVDGTRTAHPLHPVVARSLGLRAHTPVILGYLDVICVGVGAGILSPNADRGCTILGSTGMHMRLSRSAEDVVLNPGQSGYTMPFPASSMLAQMQSNMAASLNIDWISDLALQILGQAGVEGSKEDILCGFDPAVQAAPSAAVVYHPYISRSGERGPFLDQNARAQFTGLSRDTTYAGLLRSVYEGLSMAARDCYTAMGGVPREVHIAGGVAKSQAMRRILASTLGAPIRTMNRQEVGAAGAAMMATVNLGLYTDMAACAAEWVDPYLGEVTMPDPALTAVYDELFTVYRSLRRAVQPAWNQLAQLQKRSFL